VSYNKQRLHKLGYFTKLMSGQRRGQREYPAAAENSAGRPSFVRSVLDYALVRWNETPWSYW